MGGWYCNQCGGGLGIDLVMRVLGVTFGQAVEQVRGLGDLPATPAATVDMDKHRLAMNRIWEGARRMDAQYAGGMWLERRLGPRWIELSPDLGELRCSGRVRYQDSIPSYHPAMLARVRDVEGKPVNLHRTYLTADGDKAVVDSVRRMMAGSHPAGSAVRLGKPTVEGDRVRLGIAEGIETALACRLLFGISTWAALNAGRLSQWRPPASVTHVTIYADNDENYVGQMSAHELSHRLTAKGISCQIRTPAIARQDWNDVWISEAEIRIASK